MDRTSTDLYSEAQREDWARGQVAAAGKSWTTHQAKFSGAVLPRQKPRTSRYPDQVVMEQLWNQALLENWSRGLVAAAGKSWTTHRANVAGDVVPRRKL